MYQALLFPRSSLGKKDARTQVINKYEYIFKDLPQIFPSLNVLRISYMLPSFDFANMIDPRGHFFN